MYYCNKSRLVSRFVDSDLIKRKKKLIHVTRSRNHWHLVKTSKQRTHKAAIY